jgi:hypothetical protein
MQYVRIERAHRVLSLKVLSRTLSLILYIVTLFSAWTTVPQKSRLGVMRFPEGSLLLKPISSFL